jgi:hypothetical protein
MRIRRIIFIPPVSVWRKTHFLKTVSGYKAGYRAVIGLMLFRKTALRLEPKLILVCTMILSLAGSWGPDQSAEGIVYAGNQIYGGPSGWGDCTREIELLLRWQIMPYSIKGYEVNFGAEGQYGNVSINRWDGPLGGWVHIAHSTAEWTGGDNGDILKATIVGNTITVYKNGSVVLTATDGTYPSGGSPGVGFYTDLGCTGPDYHNNDYGWTAFTGTDLSRKIPGSPSIITIK